jgi:hypothetical protein
MLGSLDPAIPGLQSSVDEHGATYIKPGALTITIQSDNAWTLNCAITGNQTLHWRLGGTDTWLAFGSPDQPVACASGPAGTTVVTIDLSLQVAAGVDRGQFASTIARREDRRSNPVPLVAGPDWLPARRAATASPGRNRRA